MASRSIRIPAETIDRAMVSAGIEQQHVFARALGCGPEQVSRWRSGTPAYWSAAVVVRLLAERKVSLADVQAAAAVDDAAALSDDVGREGESGGWGVCEGAEGFSQRSEGHGDHGGQARLGALPDVA